MSLESIDEIIKKYSEELVKMGRIYGGEAEEASLTPSKTEAEETLKEVITDSDKEEKTAKGAEMAAKSEEISESEAVNTSEDAETAVKPPAVNFPEGDADSFASFSAVVFSAEGAYPVEGARIVVYRGDNIYAFVESDENGATKKVRLPAFAQENALEEDNPEQSIDYFADVFAEGFISQKGLLVSSVGGSEILLRVLMVPEEERIG